MGDEPQSVRIETDDTVTTTRKKRGPNKRRGLILEPITPDLVGDITVSAFSGAAMLRNNTVWMVQNRSLEIEPWSKQAAHLANQLVEALNVDGTQASNFGSALTVAFGLGGMIFVRARGEVKSQSPTQQAVNEVEKRRRQRDAAPTWQSEPARAGSTDAVTLPEHLRHDPASGASPRHPGQIDGLEGSGSAI